MNKKESTGEIQSQLGEPILFRTASKGVAQSTLDTGSLWLRSAEYYQAIEDDARVDTSEGINGGRPNVPLKFNVNGTQLSIQGPGYISQSILPHYIASFHGTSIPETIRQEFGGVTFGVKCFSRLSAEVLYKVSLEVEARGYCYGQVYYQYSALALSNSVIGGAAKKIADAPPIFLNPLNTDVLRKRPLEPFISQDEWRIVVMVDSYINDDPIAPLKINVDKNHFYPYLE